MDGGGTMSDRWWHRLHPAWVCVVGLVIYAPTIRFGFVDYDDPWVVRDNTLLHTLSLESLHKVFLDFSFEQRLRLGAEYLPVRDLSVMLDYALFGDWIGGHHLTHVLLYALACAFAAALVDEWTKNRVLAWVVALAWTVHPTHVESAAWLSERKGVLGAACVFASLWLLGRFRTRPGAAPLAGACLLLVMTVWSRAPAAVAVGVAVALFLWFAPKPIDRRTLVGLAVYVAAGIIAFIPVWMTTRATGLVEPSATTGLVETVALSMQVHGKYLSLMALAGPYGIDYPIAADPRYALHVAIGALASVVALGVCAMAVLRRSWRTPASFGLAWWVAFGLPVSHLVVSIQNLVADRYLLLPSLGLLLVLGAAVLKLRPTLRVPLIAAWLVSSLLWTVPQLQVWSSATALRTHMTRLFPHDAESWSNLARIALEERRPGQALKITAQGLVHSPGHWRLLNRQGLILEQRGRLKEAVAVMTQAAEAGPVAHKAQANLALLLLRVGKPQQAQAWGERAVAAQPAVGLNQRALGLAALANSDLVTACRAFGRALALDPYDRDNHSYTGLCDQHGQQGTR